MSAATHVMHFGPIMRDYEDAVPEGYRLDWSGALVREPRSHVYLVQEYPDGFIKIGRTANLSDRIVSLEAGGARPLRILAVLRETGDLERELHYEFAYAKQRGEWFHPTPRLIDFADRHWDLDVILEALSPDERHSVIWPEEIA